MNEKSITIIKTKISLVVKNNYKHAEKVFAAVGLKLTCGAILLS